MAERPPRNRARPSAGTWSEWLDRRQREAEAGLAEARRRLDRSETARSLAGEAGLEVGKRLGVARGAVLAVEDAAHGLLFVSRLVNPLDPLLNGRSSAAGQVLSTGGRAVEYGRKAFANRELAVRDGKRLVQRLNTDLNPQATPQEDSVVGEIRRNLRIGANQGEAGFNIATVPVAAGSAAKGLRVMAGMGKAAGPAKYLAMGARLGEAEYLAEPYVGWGHHVWGVNQKIPEAWLGLRLPRALAGQRLPRWYLNSDFNRVRGEGLERGEFSRIHKEVDNQYHGGRVPKRFGAGGWSAAKLGWRLKGPLERAWKGTPTPIKVIAAGAAAEAIEAAENAFDRGKRR